MLCLGIHAMVRNSGLQTPLSLVSRLRNTSVKVSQHENLCLSGAKRQALLQPGYPWLDNGRYVRPQYVPKLPPRHQHKTYHVWFIVLHPLVLTSLIPLLRDSNTAPMPDIYLRCLYEMSGALPLVDPLYHICLLEDAAHPIGLLYCPHRRLDTTCLSRTNIE